jgi:hypothetical protein
VATEEIDLIHSKLLEAAEFAKLKREGDDQLLILFWRNAGQHTGTTDAECAQVSHLAQVRSKHTQDAQGPGTMQDHLLHPVQLQ